MLIDCSNFVRSARGKDLAMTPYPIMVYTPRLCAYHDQHPNTVATSNRVRNHDKIFAPSGPYKIGTVNEHIRTATPPAINSSSSYLHTSINELYAKEHLSF